MSILKEEFEKFKNTIFALLKKIFFEGRLFLILIYRICLRIAFYGSAILISFSALVLILFYLLKYFGFVNNFGSFLIVAFAIFSGVILMIYAISLAINNDDEKWITTTRGEDESLKIQKQSLKVQRYIASNSAYMAFQSWMNRKQ